MKEHLKNYNSILNTVFLGIYAILPSLLSPLVIWALVQNQELFQNLSILQLMLLFLVATLAMALALVPTTLTSFLISFLVGWAGLPFMVLGYGLAAVISRYFLQFFDNSFLKSKIENSEKLAIYSGEIEKNSWKSVFYMRLSPFLPFSLINVFWAVNNISWFNFLSATMVGMLPRTVLVYTTGVYASSIYQHFNDNKSSVFDWGIIVLLGVFSLYGIYRILNKQSKISK